ncbi:uncharacterized protein LOC142230156 [Haematobia irritans]|uniref:uncharacterized protein LOC142230156 n=1 Tax=Haematobia irritans TaxID=7368 RepID=UPI003F50125D
MPTMKFHLNLIIINNFLLYITVVMMSPATRDLSNYHLKHDAALSTNISRKINESTSSLSDSLPSSTERRAKHTNILTTLKPRGFQNSRDHSTSSSVDSLTPAAQNYFSTFFQPSIQPLGHSRPFYQPTEEPFFRKFLQQQHQNNFAPQARQQSYSQYDSSILGSGDFGILRGGTFYSGEDQTSFQPDEHGEFYFGEASNSHSGPATEGFIQKYTYPEEQFEHFRDFADLNTPSEADFSQYVVVYAAKNSTRAEEDIKGPKNIFEQLQQIDEEKAAEERERKLKKKEKTGNANNHGSGLSKKKLKLVKTKIIKKKWNPKRSKVIEEDPLLALS